MLSKTVTEVFIMKGLKAELKAYLRENGIKTVTDVENNRKKFKEAEKKNLDSDADLTLIDWNWFDDDE